MTIQEPPREDEVPERREPPVEAPTEPPARAPGAEEPPLRLPRDNPDVETEI